MLEAEGLVEHEPNKGARVPRLDRTRSTCIYQIRERIEPLALAESIPHLTRADLDRLDASRTHRGDDGPRREFLVLDREFHLRQLRRLPVEQLARRRAGCGTPPSTTAGRSCRSAGHDRTWVVNAEHRLLIDAIRRRDTVDAERFLAGHIRRTRIELAEHPEVFDDQHRVASGR